MKIFITSIILSCLLVSCVVNNRVIKKKSFIVFYICDSEYKNKNNSKDSGSITIDLNKKLVYLTYKGYLTKNLVVQYRFNIIDSFNFKNQTVYMTLEGDYFKSERDKFTWYAYNENIITFTFVQDDDEIYKIKNCLSK